MPIHVVCEVCNAEFNLKDEYGGKRVKCASCQNILQVPLADEMPVTAEVADYGAVHPSFQRDKFMLRQKRLSLHEKYYVWDEEQRTILFVERPVNWGRSLGAGCLMILVLTGVIGLFSFLAVFAGGENKALFGLLIALGIVIGLVLGVAVLIRVMPKRHVHFYADDSRTEPLLHVQQDYKVMLLNASYTVTSPDGEPVARLRKNYLYNAFRKRWYGEHPDGSLWFVAKEDSLILSLLRRLIGPLFGVLRTNFVIMKPDQETVIGEFNRKFTLFDRYSLDMTADKEHYLDRRVAIALGVMLDTGEHR